MGTGPDLKDKVDIDGMNTGCSGGRLLHTGQLIQFLAPLALAHQLHSGHCSLQKLTPDPQEDTAKPRLLSPDLDPCSFPAPSGLTGLPMGNLPDRVRHQDRWRGKLR